MSSASTWPTWKPFWTKFPEFRNLLSGTWRTQNWATSRATPGPSFSSRSSRRRGRRRCRRFQRRRHRPSRRSSTSRAAAPASSTPCATERSVWRAPTWATWRPSGAPPEWSTSTSTRRWSSVTRPTTGKRRRTSTGSTWTDPATGSPTSSSSPSTTRTSRAWSERDFSSASSSSVPETSTGTATRARTTSSSASDPPHCRRPSESPLLTGSGALRLQPHCRWPHRPSTWRRRSTAGPPTTTRASPSLRPCTKTPGSATCELEALPRRPEPVKPASTSVHDLHMNFLKRLFT